MYKNHFRHVFLRFLTQPAEIGADSAEGNTQSGTGDPERQKNKTEQPKDQSKKDASLESETDQDTDWKAKAEHWKRLSRQNEARAKSNAQKAEAYDKLQEEQMTELEKVTARAEKAEQENVVLKRKALVHEIASRYGVPAVLLNGSTKEDLEESAQALLEFKGTSQASTSAKAAGAKGDKISGKPRQLTRSDLESMTSQQILEADRAGQLDQLKGIHT